MKSAMLYLICSLMFPYIGNRNLETIKSKDIQSVYEQTTMYFAYVEDSVSQEKRKEIEEYCNLFANIIKSKDIDKIENIMDFPLWIECFKDFSKGDTINKRNYFQYDSLVFDNIFFERLEKFKTMLNENKTKINNNGFDIGNSHFLIITSYKDEDNFESSRVFRFEKKEGKYKLTMVFCAG